MKISLVSIVYQQSRQSRLATATSSTQQYSYRFLPFSDSAMRKYYYRITYIRLNTLQGINQAVDTP